MILELGSKEVECITPAIMTILNVTPDSFYSDSRTREREAIRKRVNEAVEAGAQIIDVGGYSSRPGALEVPLQEELRRVSLGVEIIREQAPGLAISLDTFRAKVAEAILKRYGACIINDISAGEADQAMIPMVAHWGAPFIAMHMRGNPNTMQQLTQYEDLPKEIFHYFEQRIATLRSRGVQQVIVDPGFGFAKTTEQNYALLGQMHHFRELGAPILAGISRKSMIWKPLGITPNEALNGTCALHWECLRQGASILRVHDTRAAAEVIHLFELFRKGSNTK